MYEPSVLAKYFCSLITNIRDAAKLAPAASAVAFASSSRSTFSFTGTAIAFFTIGVRQLTSPTPFNGASCTGLPWMRALARAIATAWRAAAATPSGVGSFVAAKPHAPCAITRTPTPEDSVFTTFCTLSSRVISDCRR